MSLSSPRPDESVNDYLRKITVSGELNKHVAGIIDGRPRTTWDPGVPIKDFVKTIRQMSAWGRPVPKKYLVTIALMIMGWLLFSFKGRIGRGKYWFGMFLFYAYVFLAGIIGILVLELDFGPWMIFAILPGIWAIWAVYIKRLHDLNLSGKWMFVLVSLGIVLPHSLVGELLLFVPMIVLGSWPGIKEVNRFG
jgi:uncharacterized membrane protein YhaH (DUF805 family)